jgi:hypothetical protein
LDIAGYDAGMSFRQGKCLFLASVLVFAAREACPKDVGTTATTNLSSAQIVERIERHNQEQSKELKQYKALRHYQVEYQGFPANATAKMDVEVAYDASSGKILRIVSQSGSKLLCNKVLKRAVDSEREASQDKGSTALSEANYRFRLVGTESVGDRPAYMLDVDPRKESKFLYRGRIWVDATDFAVVKMETEPAKSPSFWISRTKIHYTSARTDSFWLPQHMRSETKVRIGGTAVMTIDYGTYRIGPKAE